MIGFKVNLSANTMWVSNGYNGGAFVSPLHQVGQSVDPTLLQMVGQLI